MTEQQRQTVRKLFQAYDTLDAQCASLELEIEERIKDLTKAKDRRQAVENDLGKLLPNMFPPPPTTTCSNIQVTTEKVEKTLSPEKWKEIINPPSDNLYRHSRNPAKDFDPDSDSDS